MSIYYSRRYECAGHNPIARMFPIHEEAPDTIEEDGRVYVRVGKSHADLTPIHCGGRLTEADKDDAAGQYRAYMNSEPVMADLRAGRKTLGNRKDVAQARTTVESRAEALSNKVLREKKPGPAPRDYVPPQDRKTKVAPGAERV